MIRLYLAMSSIPDHRHRYTPNDYKAQGMHNHPKVSLSEAVSGSDLASAPRKHSSS